MSSSIAPATAAPRPVDPAAGASATAAPGTVSAGAGAGIGSSQALARSLAALAFPVGPLGIRAPQNPEDAAVILAQVAAALDATVAEGRKSRIAGAFGSLQAALGLASAAVSGLPAAVDKAKADVTAAEASQAQAAAAMADAQARKDALLSASPRPADFDARLQPIEADLAAAAQAVRAADTAAAQAGAALATAQAALEAGSADLTAALARVALVFQDTRSVEAKSEAGTGAQIDRRDEAIKDGLDRLREAALARADREVEETREERDAQAERRAAALASGLGAALLDLVAVLRAALPESGIRPQDAALISGRRFQFAL